MENNYFGILTEEMYNNFSEDEMKNFLIENHIIHGKIPGTFIEDRKTNEKGGTERVIRFYTKDLVYKYSDKLVNSIFNFLNKYLVGSIETNLMMFNHSFDIKTYGYSKKRKTKEALKEFNSLFFKICEKDQIGLGKNSSDKIGAEKRFVTLKKVQGGLIEKLKGEEIILTNYLYGNNDYFTRELIDTHPYLLEIFEFENKLSIMIDLNKKFKFEEDDVFTPKTKAKIIFEEYNDKFQSLKQVEFIEQKLKNIANQNHSFVVSLFFFFKKEIKIKTPSAKIFQEIINNNFNHNFGEIKLSDPENLEHKKRLKKLHLEWH
jgi:hypothetical protein